MRDLFTRPASNPVLRPDLSHDWEKKVYNPGAVFHEGKYHLFYRAVGGGPDWRSALGYAVSEDGEHFERFPQPQLDRDPSNPWELRGLEDPRITKLGDTFHMAYAAYDGKVPRLCIATSKDLKHWTRHGLAAQNYNFITMGGMHIHFRNGVKQESPARPGEEQRSKAGAIFPEKIGGKYWMAFNEHLMWLANSDDGIHWNVLPDVFLTARKNPDLFDSAFVETGPPPIKTEKGWLLMYHGVNDAIQYHLGIVLLDLNDPTKILYRSDEPIFGPREKYELSGIVDIIPGVMELFEKGKEGEAELKALLKKAESEGFMPQVTFTTAALVVDGIVRLYYGASDEFVCTATAKLSDILSTIS
jgi:predicted GH43/DUF377 family glycosyl hydrolase